jgi:hypothetical protein
MTDSRKKLIETRAGEVVRDAARKKLDPVSPEAVWDRIFEAIPRSAFLLGKTPPGKGYNRPMRLSIDYVLRQKEFLKIFVGGYDDDPRYRNNGFDAATGRSFGPAEEATRAAIASLGSSRSRRDSGGDSGSDDGGARRLASGRAGGMPG